MQEVAQPTIGWLESAISQSVRDEKAQSKLNCIQKIIQGERMIVKYINQVALYSLLHS
jgi:hypothetical protein